MKFFISVLALVVAGHCGPVAHENETVLKSVIGNFVNCMNTDLSLCLKEKALHVTERVGAIRQLKLIEGVSIVNNALEKEGRSLEPLSTDPEVRRREVTERLFERGSRLLENADLQISFDVDEDEEAGRAVGEARDKKKKAIKKKLKILLPLLVILKLKVIAIITLAIVVIAASLFKLAAMAKIVFIAKAIHVIKELIAKHHHRHEEPWIPHHEESWTPHHEEHASHGHEWEGGWSRSRNEANNLAYSAYNQS